ncbi:MAG: hypothetical protein PHS76_04845 [Sphaerochaeta sp.]|jgi:hypothetical protein|nr:hypothetical protein [Sphaerochaeta sp.]
MKPKRLSVRFNMDSAADRRAWEYLQGAEASKNKTVIAAINAYFGQDRDIADIIRQTIRESLKDISVVAANDTLAQEQAISEDESSLLDTLDDFLA